ncbi:MliC family protein [bacterium]|nr:MliC family protein [bacterium]
MSCRQFGKGAAGVLLVALVLGCNQAKESRQTESAPETFVFRCAGTSSVSVHYEPEVAVLRLSDREVRLPQVVSGSGARYSDGKTTFWTKGDTARLEVDGHAFECNLEAPAR